MRWSAACHPLGRDSTVWRRARWQQDCASACTFRTRGRERGQFQCQPYVLVAECRAAALAVPPDLQLSTSTETVPAEIAEGGWSLWVCGQMLQGSHAV